MTANDITKILYNTLDEKLAKDIRVLEVTELTSLADFFIIATCTSSSHLKALVDYCEKAVEDVGERPHHIEGRTDGSWTLMDYSSVVLHLFLEDSRKFYSIERLWADAKQWRVD